MTVPPGFKIREIVVRIITCPKCGHQWDDTFPGDVVPPRGRKFKCAKCLVITTAEYPEPFYRLT